MPYFESGYKLEFEIKDGDICDVFIYDRESVSVDPVETTFISLNDANGKAPEDAVLVKTETRSEDKLGDAIRPKEATIKFFSTSTVSMSTFATGEDNRWYVEIKVRAKYTLFIGHLITDNLAEPFLDKEINTVTLRATDGLAGLEKIKLVKTDGTNPRGKFKLIEYIYWALELTGVNLLIYSMNNLRLYVEDIPIAQMYRKAHLDAKTFEDEINESVSAWDALMLILGRSCYLSQRDGKWWIQRVDELEGSDQYVSIYENGVFITEETWDLEKLIGFNENMYLSEEVTEVGILRPNKYVALHYPFQFPKELINNIDFERGDERDIVEQTIPNGLKFDHDDWTIYRRYPNKGTPLAATASAYILRMYEDGYEKQRYLVLKPGSTSAFPPNHIETTEGTPMHTGDKFTWSFDFKLASNISGTGAVNFPIAHVRLESDGGTIYTLKQDGTWVASPQYEIINTTWQREQYDESTEWQTIAVEAKPLPANGSIFYGLYHANMVPANGYNGDIHFQNLQLTYSPLVNGSYMKYREQ